MLNEKKLVLKGILDICVIKRIIVNMTLGT